MTTDPPVPPGVGPTTRAARWLDRAEVAGVSEEWQVPAGVDPTVPAPARMYDYVLGGRRPRAGRHRRVQVDVLRGRAMPVRAAWEWSSRV